MQEIIGKLAEIETGEVGVIVYSPTEENVVASFNSELNVPLASAGKVVIVFLLTKWVELGKFHWDDQIEDIQFDEVEDSKELYPHFQGRKSISLRNVVEIMIACHDNRLAKRLVDYCGGWDAFNEELSAYFPSIHLKPDPRDFNNAGNLSDVFIVIAEIFASYQVSPDLWEPVVSGLVRQQGGVEEIPFHHLNHMTGGLPNVIVHLGVIGEFHRNPLLYVIGMKDVPDRFENREADEKVMEALKMIYYKLERK